MVPLFEILKEFYQCIILEIVQADFSILNIAAVCYIDSLVVSVFLEKLHLLKSPPHLCSYQHKKHQTRDNINNLLLLAHALRLGCIDNQKCSGDYLPG